MKKLWRKIVDALERVRERIGRALGEPSGKPEDQPTSAVDAVPFGKLKWNRGGEDFSNASWDERVRITSAKIAGSGTPTFVYEGNGLGVWPARSENINAIFAIFFDADKDGFYERGGKADWARSNAAPRPLQHVHFGYSNWDGYPKSGTPWAVVLTDASGKRRSNVVAGVWP